MSGTAHHNSDGARRLTSEAASAFAAGLRGRGDELLAAARAQHITDELRQVGDLLQVAFGGRATGRHSWVEHLEVTQVLMHWQQRAAAFGVLASAPSAAPGCGTLRALLDRIEPRDRDLFVGVILLRDGQVSRCLPPLNVASDMMHAAGEWGGASLAYGLLAEAAVCLGHVPTGLEALHRLRTIRLARPGIAPRQSGDLVDALLAARQGRTSHPESVPALQRALLSADRSERDRAELVCAISFLECERWGDAFDILTELVAHLDGSRSDLVAWGLLSHLADAARHTGQVNTARRLVSDLGDIDGLFEGDNALAELLYATAVLSDPGRADDTYKTLLSHDPARWPWLTARARLAYGQHLRRQRQVGDARGHLVAAHRLFVAMGVPAWERRAAGELRAAGARTALPGEPSQPCISLSAQELQIARLASRGLSNREIGQRLFLSPRTIGSHLYRIFPKLNITSRHELQTVMNDRDELDRGRVPVLRDPLRA